MYVKYHFLHIHSSWLKIRVISRRSFDWRDINMGDVCCDQDRHFQFHFLHCTCLAYSMQHGMIALIRNIWRLTTYAHTRKMARTLVPTWLWLTRAEFSTQILPSTFIFGLILIESMRCRSWSDWWHKMIAFNVSFLVASRTTPLSPVAQGAILWWQHVWYRYEKRHAWQRGSTTSPAIVTGRRTK